MRLHTTVLGFVALWLAACAPEPATPEPSQPTVEETAQAAIPQPEEWPFEECDRDGATMALNACAIEDLNASETRMAGVLDRLREATRKEGLDMGARDDPDDPERTLFTTYGPSSWTDALDEAQTTWITYRDKQCDWETMSIFAGQGSARHMEYMYCQVRLNEERTSQLQQSLAQYETAF